MKKLIISVLSLFLYVNSSFALTYDDVPDEFTITEHWVSLTTSFDIETKTRKLGTLYRKFFSLLLTYEFFDPYDNKLATAKLKFFSLSTHFDVYDHHNNLIGVAEERMLSFFPTFDIYASDAATKLARAKMNFWGTKFTIYDPETDQEMAIMYRSFFRLKNDWTIRITNRPLFLQKHIDFRLLMTVLAFQVDKEYWESYRRNNDNNNTDTSWSNNRQRKPLALPETISEVDNAQISSLLEKIAAINKQEGLDSVKKPNQKTLEAIASELENNYKNTHDSSDINQTNEEKIKDFTNYCLNLIQSDSVPATKKKAILFLLKMRLESSVS